jgi:hypothetical protein
MSILLRRGATKATMSTAGTSTPPAEAEQRYYAMLDDAAMAA